MLFGEKSFKIRCMDYKRPLHADILRVYSQDYPVLQAIVGPRQEGKTTLAKQFMADLDIPSVYASANAPIPPGPEWIETQWHLALRKAAETGKVLLVLEHPGPLPQADAIYPEARAWIIGGSGIPLEEFLSVPARDWFKEKGPTWGAIVPSAPEFAPRIEQNQEPP